MVIIDLCTQVPDLAMKSPNLSTLMAGGSCTIFCCWSLLMPELFRLECRKVSLKGTGAIVTGCSFHRHQWILLDSNPGPVGYKSNALTTRPWLLPVLSIQTHIIFSVYNKLYSVFITNCILCITDCVLFIANCVLFIDLPMYDPNKGKLNPAEGEDNNGKWCTWACMYSNTLHVLS